MALMAREFEVVPLHFCLYPYTCEEAFLVAMRVLGDLKDKVGFKKALVYPWSKILRKIMGGKDRRYACLECRRGMFRVAELVCEREGASAIVTGESLGQKATQTLSNLAATSSGIKYPILRPLLGLDKLEIEQLSRKLGIWHEVHAGCCYATPKYPKTRADPAALDAMFKELGMEGLMNEEFGNVLEVRTFKEDFRRYLETLA
jgi:thiamine biosynthesis protein ThiI